MSIETPRGRIRPVELGVTLLLVSLFLYVPLLAVSDRMFRGAARRGNVVGAKFWLVVGANINSREPEGNTALTWAIIYGRREMVSFLLKKKIEFPTNSILAFVPNGHEDIADVLKQYGAVENWRRDGRDAYGCKMTPEQHRFANFTNQ